MKQYATLLIKYLLTEKKGTEPIWTEILFSKKYLCRFPCTPLPWEGKGLTKVISDVLAFCQTQHPAFCPSDLPPPLSLLHNKYSTQTAHWTILIYFFKIKASTLSLPSKISFWSLTDFWEKTKLIRHSVSSGLKFRLKASSADTLTEESWLLYERERLLKLEMFSKFSKDLRAEC